MTPLETVIARVLNVSSSVITDESTPQSIESWDSFNGLMLVSELEKEYNVKFSLEEIISVKKVSDIRRILKEHNVAL